MTQKDKELLLKDLCARLAYGVKGIITYDRSNTKFTIEGIDNNVLHLSNAEECYVEDFKLYLRPMSSMTKEEKKSLDELLEKIYKMPPIGHIHVAMITDWFLERHFDIHDLIPKELALEAPEGMYKLKEK